MRKSIFSAFLLLSCSFVFAQQTKDIDSITIHGKILNTPYAKVSENMEVITRKDIENSPAQSIDEVLQQYSGMDIRRRGANGVQSDVSIRGGSFDQVLILLNGVRMNDSQTGHNSLNIPVDLASVERIEIIKGPAARRFGQNAYAGAINIITKTSSEESARISAEGGDFSSYALGLSSTFGRENFTNLFQVSTNSSDGYRHNTDYEIRNVYYQNKFALQNGSIGLQAGFSEKKFGANGFYSSPNATEQYEEMQASIVSVQYEQRFQKWNIHSNVNWRRGQDMYLYNREKPEIYRNMHIGNNFGAEVNANYASSLGVTGFGAEFRKEFLASNNLGNQDRLISQLFFEHRFSLLSDRLQIIPGISWADFSNAGNYFYPGLDVGFDFNEHHKIYGNIAKVNRVPTFTDLYYLSRTESGNVNLQPENAVSSEVGYQFKKRNWMVKASVFMRDTDNMIDWIKNNHAELWTAENIAQVKTKGFETEVQIPVDAIHTNINLSYTYLDNSFEIPYEFSKYVAENLRHQFIAKLENRFLKYFSNQLTYRYLERVSTGKYQLLDEKLTFKKGNFETYLLVNNLTNTDYTEVFGVPMPGRWFHLGVAFTLK